MAAGFACLICDAPLGKPVYHLDSPSLNSLSRIHPGSAEVFFCDRCSHLQTTPLTNTQEYYEKQYTFHTGSLDEDRIYVDPTGHKKFETEFRAEVLLAKL